MDEHDNGDVNEAWVPRVKTGTPRDNIYQNFEHCPPDSALAFRFSKLTYSDEEQDER